jgi:hypothetical protein
MAAAALATVNPIAVTTELPTPALERGQPQAVQQSQIIAVSTICHALIDDGQGHLAVVRRHQSSLSSPQKA